MKQIRDHFFKQAKRDGYAARSAYKLKEIDTKHRLLKKGAIVLDLGCYPGSWLQYIAQKIGKEGQVIGVDRTELRIPLQPNMTFIHSDINDLDPDTPELSNLCFDLVCSDMAPDSTGIRNVDAERSAHLCRAAMAIALPLLKNNGNVLLKTFHGSAFDSLRQQLKSEYQHVKTIKPKSSRSESKEVFLLGSDRIIQSP